MHSFFGLVYLFSMSHSEHAMKSSNVFCFSPLQPPELK